MDHDQNFKNLILDYPRQALELFAAPHAAELRSGAIITPVRQEQLKDHLGSRYRELDLPFKVTWPDGRQEALLFVLEEETDPRRFSIRRLAHYCLDLTELLETDRVVPVVIFLRAGGFQREIVLGHDADVYLNFRFVAYVLAAEPARNHLQSANIVARLNLPNMAHAREERVEVYGRAMQGLLQLEPDWKRRQKYIDFIDIYAGLDETERAQWRVEFTEEAEEMTLLSERLREEGRQEVREQVRQEVRQEVHKEVEKVRRPLVALLLQQLSRRFGDVPTAAVTRVESADAETLLRWLARVPDANSSDDVIG